MTCRDCAYCKRLILYKRNLINGITKDERIESIACIKDEEVYEVNGEVCESFDGERT